MDTITEEILAIEDEIRAQGYDIDKVLDLNNIGDDEDMIMFALRYLLSNIDDALLDDDRLEKESDNYTEDMKAWNPD
jgi:hypothetical protein